MFLLLLLVSSNGSCDKAFVEHCKGTYIFLEIQINTMELIGKSLFLKFLKPSRPPSPVCTKRGCGNTSSDEETIATPSIMT